MPKQRNGNHGLTDFTALLTLVERQDLAFEKMGLFSKQFHDVTHVTVERKLQGDDDMYTVERGGSRQVAGDDTAVDGFFNIPFATLDKSTKANEIQDLRKFATSADPMKTSDRVMAIAARIQRSHRRFLQASMYHALTNLETFARDSAGAARAKYTKSFQTIFEVANANMFTGTANGVDATILDLTDANTDVAGYFEGVRSHVIAQAGDAGDNYKIVSLMDTESFNALEKHPDYVAAFSNYASQEEPLRKRLGGLSNERVLEWKGHVYMEDMSGRINRTGATAGRMISFPLGMDGMFQTHYAPADTEEHANTVAKEGYVFLESDKRNTKIESEVSLVCVVTRPELVCNTQTTHS